MRSKADPEVEIIRALKGSPSGFVSGEALRKSLGLSRTAVWKHINNLKDMGFLIEAKASRGYTLRPCEDPGLSPFNSVEIASSLKTSFIGQNLFFYHSIDSTNRKAFELARSGAPEGTAVIADAQTFGRGRLERRWESPPGLNLYLSLILRPPLPPYEAQKLTLLMAVASAEAINAFVPGGVGGATVKWPNDILIGSRKAAGILMEMDSEPDRVNFIVAGIGVNINMAGADMPPPIRGIATSLREKAGRTVSRPDFTLSLFSSIEKWYKVFLEDGDGGVLKRWRELFAMTGKTVKVTGITRTVEGVCLGIDDSGALLLRLPSGEVERVISGDLGLSEPSR